MKTIMFLILIVFSGLSILAQTPEWFIKLEKLQKFPSTEKDLERLFNSPKITYSTSLEEIMFGKIWTKSIKYALPEGELSVYYSAGKCSEENTEGYDLEDGVILDYYFQLENLVPSSFLKLSSKKFTLTESMDSGHLFYEDKKKRRNLYDYRKKTSRN